MSLKPIICCKEYTITAFSAVNNDELRDVVKCGCQAIFAETLDKTLACTYKVYGDNYVHVEFADNVISYVYDQYDGWSVRGVSREDSVSALKALYVKLGGDYTNVAGCVTDLEVLNKISVLYNGEDGARSYTEAINNIADVIEPIREKWDGSATGLSEGSGDVNVSYKGSLIGSLSDTGSAVLKTKDVNCEDDIEVEYVKPSSAPVLPTLTVTNNDLGATYAELGSCPFVKIDGENIVNSIVDEATNYIPNPTESGFEFIVQFVSPNDDYIVAANGYTAEYDNIRHLYGVSFDLDNYNTPVTLSITSKGTGK